jgi:hypothetical protein
MKIDNNVVKIVSKLIKISQTIDGNTAPEKAGGWLTLASSNCENINSFAFHPISKEKEIKYLNFSREKAHRLYAHFLREGAPSIFSSYQSRSPEENKWGGSVIFGLNNDSKIISFSGLTEHCDEALSLSLGYYLGLENDEKFAKRVIDYSQNPIFEEMFHKTQKSLIF